MNNQVCRQAFVTEAVGNPITANESKAEKPLQSILTHEVQADRSLYVQVIKLIHCLLDASQIPVYPVFQ